ncbi:uncharacterized protein PG986_014200 [Apiospora aurea]|uniref:Uncharacterized protein n=1 Tax=Apiospora aurea TaxID=335848 RepID=A0ABR1PSL5_9PEZI
MHHPAASQEGEPAAVTTGGPPRTESPILLPLPAQIAADLSITAISWFMCSLFFILLFAEPNLISWIRVICVLFLAPVSAIIIAVKRLRRDGFTLRVAKDPALFWIFVTVWAIFGVDLEKGRRIVSMESTSRRLYAAGTPFLSWYAQSVGTGIIAVGIGTAGLRYVDAWAASNLSPPPTELASQKLFPTFLFAFPFDMVRWITGYKIWSPAGPEPFRVWGMLFPRLWCLVHFLTTLLLYYSIFDSSKTVKPGWTELLA